MTNRQLVWWMFKFLAPVKPLVFLACFYLAAFVGCELLAVRQTGQAIDHIKLLAVDGQAPAGIGFWNWLFAGEGQPLRVTSLLSAMVHHDPATPLRDIILILVVLTAAILVLRYCREVANSKLSMTMVFYLREAIYDKLQRVGFGYHDALTSGQLINRALSDLQNVRQFVQSSVLTTLEIGLVVLGNIILIGTRSPWVALLALVPLPIWTWYILRFSKIVQPAASRPRIISTPPAKNSVRYDACAIERMTGLKLANRRMRASVRCLNVSQLAVYLSISCRSVANAFTTCTPAMFSVMIETFLSSASMTCWLAGWTFLLKRMM